MTPQEKDLLTQLSDRLRKGGAQQKDPEAEAMIRDTIADQPDAPYMLAQTVLIQDFALAQAQAQIAQLQQQLAAAKAAPAPRSGGFLSGLFGGNDRPAQPPQPQMPPQGGPWNRGNPGMGQAPGYSPQGSPQGYPPQASPYQANPGQGGPWGGQQQGPMGGGMFGGGGMMGQQPSFLRSAATTALGIAGGAMLFQGIQSMFGHTGGGLIGSANAHEPSLSEQAGLTPGYGSGGGDSPSDAGGSDPGYGNGGYDQGSYDPASSSQGGYDQGGQGGADQGYGTDPGYQDAGYDPGYAPQSDVQDASWGGDTQDSGWGGDSGGGGGDDWV